MIYGTYSSSRFHQKCVSKQLAISESDHGSVVFHAVCWCVRQQLATVLCCKYSIFFFQQGTVTKCVLPEAGVYELDGRVRLYLTHSECLNMCRGMRCGAVVELHNVHVMKLSGTPWKVAKL